MKYKKLKVFIYLTANVFLVLARALNVQGKKFSNFFNKILKIQFCKNNKFF